MLLNQHQYQVIKETLHPFRPTLIGIFGSYARGEANENSDLDILVSFREKVNLWDLIGLEEELTEKLHIDVDLITERSLNPLIIPFIYKELKVISNEEE